MDHMNYMEEALLEANKALLYDEVPVGCVIVKNNEIIARGHNIRETQQSAIGHAEIVAIQNACQYLNSWRLDECDLYVTLEPCCMCAGAILQARIRKVIYGAYDPKGGALGSSFSLYDIEGFNHYPVVEKGVMKEECSKIIKDFFRNKRRK